MRSRIILKLDEISTYISELEDILPTTENEYCTNITKRRAAEKTIELAIENVIDIVSMIVSSKKLGLPKSEDDLIGILEKKKILSKSLSQKLHQMKGFRNLLMHKYGVVDDKKSYAYLTTDLKDFTLFCEEVKKHMKK
jgi:uncharacterized protein YutE (UPF0331/DUF86 family)